MSNAALDDPSYPAKIGNVVVLVNAPRFSQKENVCLVVLVGAPAKFLLKYALADERKRSEFFTAYPLVTLPKSMETVVITLAPAP